MKKHWIVFPNQRGNLPKMNNRNFPHQSRPFISAAYKTDAEKKKAEEDAEKAFLEEIKELDEVSQAIAKRSRTQFKAFQNEIAAEMISKTAAEAMMQKAIDEATGPLKAIIEAQKEYATKLGVTVTGLKTEGIGGGAVNQSFKAQIYKAIEENAEAIKEAFAGGKVVEFAIKSPALITTGAATSPDDIPNLFGIQNSPPSNVNLRSDSVLDMTTSISTNQAVYPYTETLPKDGDFAFQDGEGAAKAQIDFKMETRYANPVTLAAWEKLSQQSVQDIPRLQSVATDFLLKKHNRKKAVSILFGTGANGEPTGATLYASAFVPGALANAVDKPNIMDVVNAVITSIFITHDYQDEMGYMANLAMMHPVDFFINFVSAKDDNGHPLFPTAGLFNRVTIGGVTILPSEDIPAGKIFVADMSKYYTTNYLPYTVKIGWVNDDFIKNQFVILGESRFHAFVKKLDEKAFVYDDIATVKNAIAIVP